MNKNVYFNTLGEALQSHVDSIHAQGGVFADNFLDMYAFVLPLRYCETWQDSKELASLKGKGTRKYAHSAIYRMDCGRYELTSYIA